MDPFTAICNLITAYINFAAARFAAMPPAQQAEIGAIEAQIIKDMYATAVKVQDNLAILLKIPHPAAVVVVPPK